MDLKAFARKQVESSLRTGMRIAARQLRNPNNANLLADLVGSLTSNRPGTTTEQRQQRPRRGNDDYVGTRKATRHVPKQRFPKKPDGGYPGDYTGTIKPSYKPDLDGDADPGEIIWGWVPYEEDPTQGKDRPVLIIGRHNKWLLGLMLTSKDNVPGGVGDVRTDEHHTPYINVGVGNWDRQGRASEIRLDRVIRIDARDVRREGAIMPMSMFSRVVDAIDAPGVKIE